MLLGREAELELLRSGSVDRGLVVVRGAIGVGKTALVRQLAAEHQDGRRGRVRLGQAIPAMQQRSYQPLLHALSWPPQPSDSERMAARVRASLCADDLLVLEDLQWADAATLQVLVGLRGHCGIVLTVQDGAPRRAAVRRLAESLGATTVVVGPLDDASMEALVRRRAPGLLRGEYRRLVADARGIPLLAEVLISTGGDRPSGPAGPSAVIDALVARRTPAARAGLMALGLAPVPLPADAVDGLDELLAAGMALERPDGRIELTHRHYADAAVGGASVAQRRHTWCRLAAVDGLSAAQRAECHMEAGSPDAALELALAAADGPITRPEQAAALRIAALASRELHRQDPAVVGRDQVDALTVGAARALNDTASFDLAAELIGDPTGIGPTGRVGAVLEACRSALGRGDRRSADALARTSAGLLRGATGQDAARARWLREMLASWSGGGARPRALEDLAAQYRGALGSGAERSQAALLVGIASFWHDADDATEWFRVAKAEAAAGRAMSAEFEATRNLVMLQTALGHHTEARSLSADCARRAADAGDDSWAMEFTTLDVLSRFYDDEDHDDALSWLSSVRTGPVRLETRAMATSVLATLLADRCDVARSGSVLREWLRPEAMEGFEPMVQAVLLWGAAQRAWIIGDLPEVVRCARWVSDLVPSGYPTLAGTHVVWRWAEYESGSAITAPTPTGGLLDCAQLEAGAIDLLVAGRPDAAAERFLAAADSWRPILWRCALRSRWAAGHALHLAGDDAGAVELLEALDPELDRSGCPALRPRVTASLRSASGRRTGGRGSGRGEVVSPQERRVLLLVADGLTSAEIGRRLGVSVATVNSHVRSATRKLGTRTRIEAAAAIARSGGASPG